MNSDTLNAWTSEKLRECYSEVAQEDEQRKSIVQLILQKSTHFLRRIFVPVEGQGGVTVSYVCPHCHRFSSRHGDGKKKRKTNQCNWWSAACGNQYDWRIPNGDLVILDSKDRSEAKVFRAHAPRNGVCENLVCALKALGEPADGR